MDKENIDSLALNAAPETTNSEGASMSYTCQKCGKSAQQIGGYLHRVNEIGVKGIWECRPSCDADNSFETNLMLAIDGKPEFKREPRYIVFKINDIHNYLDKWQIRDLINLGTRIAEARERDGKPPFNAVVVEQDWPEFEPTWAAIEERMTK